MKKFNFNLEALYKLRKNVEKKRQSEVAEISAMYNREKDGKDNCIQKINDGINIVDNMEYNDEMLAMSIYLGEYIYALKSQISIHEENMSNINVELIKRQEVLQEATKQRRAVELLKEKKLLEYKKMMDKEEQVKLDEWKKEYIAYDF